LRDNVDVRKKLDGEVRKALNLPASHEAVAAAAESAAAAKSKK